MAKPRIPKLCHHKASNRAYIAINGRRIYLGKWKSEAARQAYGRFLTEGKVTRIPLNDGLSVVELCERYIDEAFKYYRDVHGRLTPEYDSMRLCAIRLVELFGRIPVDQFGPNSLRNLREHGIREHKLCRSEANRLANRVKRIFKWGVAHELIPATVYQALTALEPLKRGRCNARETAPRKAVALEHVEAIRPYVAPQIWALVQLQLYTGARPSELLKLRPCDVDTSREVWESRPEDHKTAYRDRERVIFFGQKAQVILRPYLLRAVDAYMFSPVEAVKELAAGAETHRRANQKPSPRKTPRRVRDCYTTQSYGQAIKRGLNKARQDEQRLAKAEGRAPRDIEVWTPYQLRHTAATLIRERYGLDGAQVVLGHARADVTQVYAHVDQEKARQIAANIG